MPRKPQATIVEDFDDDTDLPLPSRPLPNTGTKGALIKSVDSDDSDPESDDDDDGLSAARQSAFNPGPASPSQLSPGFGAQSPQQLNPTVSDLTPYKKCILPPSTQLIYFFPFHLGLIKLLFLGGHVSTQYT